MRLLTMFMPSTGWALLGLCHPCDFSYSFTGVGLPPIYIIHHNVLYLLGVLDGQWPICVISSLIETQFAGGASAEGQGRVVEVGPNLGLPAGQTVALHRPRYHRAGLLVWRQFRPLE